MASPYVAPVPSNVRVKRLDHGVDYQGNPGQKVVAIGNAVVDAVKSDPDGFGTVVYYTLTDGPHAGQQIYVGHARPDVRPGQTLAIGDPVATLQQVSGGDASGLVGWTEIGLAKDGAPQFSKDQGGVQFQQLLVGAAKTPVVAPQNSGGAGSQEAGVPADPTPPSGITSASLDVPQFGTPPDATDPTVEMPGTAQHYLPDGSGVASTWQAVAALPDLSPDTQRLIQLASGG